MLDFVLIYGQNRRPLPRETLEAFRGKQVKECLFPYSEAASVLSEKQDRLAVFAAGPELRRHLSRAEGGGWSFFDGSVIQKKRLRTDIRDLSPIIEEGEKDHLHVFGTYCHGLFSDRGANHLHRDVLGFYPLFIGFGGGFFVVSNNHHLAAQALCPADYKKRKNIMAALANVVSVDDLDLETAYSGVYRMPQNAGLGVDENNSPAMYELCDTFYAPLDREQWDGLFDRVNDQLLGWAHVVFERIEENGTLSDVSGGHDTRVALALAAGAGLHRKCKWRCAGHPEGEDIVVARQIADTLGLDMQYQAAGLKDSFQGLDSGWLWHSLRRALGGMCAGWILPEAQLPHDYDVPPGISCRLFFGGYTGEMYRSHVAHWMLKRGRPDHPLGPEHDDIVLHEIITNKNMIELMRPEAAARFKRTITDRLNTIENIYDIDLFGHRGYYPLYHGGQSIRCFQKAPNLVMVGNNNLMHKLTHALPAEVHAAHRMTFKIVEKNCPPLMNFPFATMFWHHPLGYYDHPRVAEIYGLEGVVRDTPPLGALIRSKKMVELIQSNHELDFGDDIYEIMEPEKLRAAFKPLMEDPLRDGFEAVRMNFYYLLIKGADLWMRNQELPPAANAAAPVAGNLAAEAFPPASSVYAPDKNAFRQPAREVIERGELFFQQDKVFRARNRQQMNGTEKLIFNLTREARARR